MKIHKMKEEEVPPQLTEWTWPTTSGRQLIENEGPDSGTVLLCPYNSDGRLIPKDELGALGE